MNSESSLSLLPVLLHSSYLLWFLSFFNSLEYDTISLMMSNWWRHSFHSSDKILMSQPAIVWTLCSRGQRSTKRPHGGGEATMGFIKTIGMSPCMSVSAHSFVLSLSSCLCVFVIHIFPVVSSDSFYLCALWPELFLFLSSHKKHSTSQKNSESCARLQIFALIGKELQGSSAY